MVFVLCMCLYNAAKLVHARRALSSPISNLIRSRFQVKPATLLIPVALSYSLWWRSVTVPGTKVTIFSKLMWGVVLTACVVCFFFQLGAGPLLHWYCCLYVTVPDV